MGSHQLEHRHLGPLRFPCNKACGQNRSARLGAGGDESRLVGMASARARSSRDMIICRLGKRFRQALAPEVKATTFRMGLDHTWWRKYESTAGRWTSPDPLRGNIGDPQSFNRYSYTQNDPVNFVDPRVISQQTRSTRPTVSNMSRQSQTAKGYFLTLQ